MPHGRMTHILSPGERGSRQPCWLTGGVSACHSPSNQHWRGLPVTGPGAESSTTLHNESPARRRTTPNGCTALKGAIKTWASLPSRAVSNLSDTSKQHRILCHLIGKVFYKTKYLHVSSQVVSNQLPVVQWQSHFPCCRPHSTVEGGTQRSWTPPPLRLMDKQ